MRTSLFSAVCLSLSLMAAGCGSDGESIQDGAGGSSAGGAAGQAGQGGASGAGGQAGQGSTGGSGGQSGAAGAAGQGGSGGTSGQWLPRHNEKSPLGTNLTGISDWSTETPFVDLFKTSRPWISGEEHGAWDDKRPIDLDDHGWVKSLKTGQIVRSLVLWNEHGHYPKGRYTVLYDGKGKLTYRGGATKDDGASGPGRDVLDVDTSMGGVELDIRSTDPADPIRNIRFLMPGGVCQDNPYKTCATDSDCGGACEMFVDNYETQVFYPGFLDTVKTYRAIRYMDWMSTNNSDLASWADRPKLDDARWRSHGVPVEVMVDLANRLGADPWFCMPHLADDTFVTKFADYVHGHLRGDLKASVEYSNEVWNGMFEQADYATKQGASLSSNQTEARSRYYAKRSVEVFKLWETSYGGAGGFTRIVASQAANTGIAEMILSYKNTSKSADALAIAPYFGWIARPSDAAVIGQTSLDDLMDRVQGQDVPKAVGYMKANKVVADTYKLALVAYEGGQHYVGAMGGENEDAINTKFDAVNRDPRIKQAYLTYLKGWKDAGGHVFMHFVNAGTWNKWGRWGALEYTSQSRSSAPKYDGLQTFIESNDKWWP